MAQIKALFDEYGVIYKANKILPDIKHKISFLEALAELEDNENHRTHNFPKTQCHRVTGIKENIYRAYINKTSGWRIHLQYANNQLHLKDVLEGQKHDMVTKSINAKKYRYKK